MIGLTIMNQRLMKYERYNLINFSHFSFNCNKCSLNNFKNSKGKIKMKLFYKKDFEKSQKEVAVLKEQNANLLKCKEELTNWKDELLQDKYKLENELAGVQKDLIEANAEKHDLLVKIVKLEKDKAKLENELTDVKKINLKKILEIENVQQDLKKANSKISSYELTLYELKQQNRNLASSKGGYVKNTKELRERIASLEETISVLNVEISDLKSDRYLVKKVPSGRPAKTQEMKSKPSVTTKSSVSKFINEEHLSL